MVTDSGEIGRELRRRLRVTPGADPITALQLLCVSCTGLLSVDGVAVSVIQGDTGRGGYGASDEVAAHVDEMQFTLGEGPCQDVLQGRRPVLIPDIDTAAGRWPSFAAAAAEAGFAAVFAFPVQIGAVLLGVLDLFRSTSGPLGPDELAGALTVADLAAVTLVAQPDGSGADPAWLDVGWLGHVEVHQATGMLVVQLGVGPREALARLRAYAFTQGSTATEVARMIVRGDLRLARDEP